MTAKEKAKELVQQFADELINNGARVSKGDCKQCALIAVNEILDVCKTYLSSYYLEVKKEIEKL